MTADQPNPPADNRPRRIEMPAPTVWPMVLALGVTVMAAGLVSNWVITAYGGALFVLALGGWISQLLPGQGHEEEVMVPAGERARPVHPPRPVEPLRPGLPGSRMQIPEKIHPYSAGARGGLLGGAAMALIAILWGAISGHGIWYPINLLAGTLLPGLNQMPVGDLEKFNFGYLMLAIVIHAAASVAAGLLYGVLLPMLPRWPILFGGIIGPTLWTGVCYGFMGVLNPTLDEKVDWPWFIVSQFAFGLTVGFWVLHTEKVPVEPLQTHPAPAHPPHTEGQA
jgi:hypothetical protein